VKSISPETQRLISDLNQPRGFVKTLTTSRIYVSLLISIGNSKEPAAIIEILPFVLSKKRDVAEAAASAVHKLVSGTTSEDLAWLDYALRRRSPYSGNSFYKWHKISPEDLVSLERFDAPLVSLLGMASFHQNGYVRGAAINRLNTISGGAELRFLILRLNDWVSNVRAAAYDAVRSRLRPEYGAAFVATLPLVARLERAGRADHAALIQAINELLQSDRCRSVLLESLETDNRFIRRASFRLLLDSTGSDLEGIVRQALADKDTVIRLAVAQRVGSLFSAHTLEQFLALMSRDRYMPVRREALRCYVRSAEQANSQLLTALLDPHASMREEARYHLQTIAAIDFAAFYRQSLLTGRENDLYAAVSGLGETGIPEDDVLILPYVSHQNSKIRKAAIKALAKLNGKAHLDVFFHALRDEVPSVSRQALNALSDKTSLVTGERIWEVFHSAVTPHVKRNALSLIQRLSKWESICYLINAIREANEEVADMSRFAIGRWLIRFNRSFVRPTDQQISRLVMALEESGDLLNEKTKEQIRFSIKSF
jgi:HEAT repeat protein